MMEKYIFLMTACPELTLEEPPKLTFKEFLTLCNENLTKQDQESLYLLLEYYDLQNLHAYLSEKKLSSRASLTSAQSIETAILEQSRLSSYVLTFLEEYEKTTDRLAHFSCLYPLYFQTYQHIKKGFLYTYLAFEREWRLVMLGLRAKKQERDLTHELRYEDESDSFVMEILAQKDAHHYEPPAKYTDLKLLFEENEKNPLEFEKQLINYRLNRIERFVEKEYFTIDKVLSYLVRLITIEEWYELDAQKGTEIVESMIEELS